MGITVIWVDTNFFETAKSIQELNQRVRQCKSSTDVIALAKEY